MTTHVFLNDRPYTFSLDFHVTVMGRTPDEIRTEALGAARDFFGPSAEETGLVVLSADVEMDEQHQYKGTVVIRQATE
jgi:hypothetical protein